MSKLNFTAAALKAHFDQHPTSVAYDTQQRGCCAYRTSTGHISLMAHYRVHDKQIKKTIGRLGELSVAEFRARVAALVVAGKAGEDVVGDRKREAAQAVTLGEIYLAHRESMVRRKCSAGSLEVYAATWRNRLEKHASRQLASITKADVRNWHAQWRVDGPTAANRGVKLLSVLFNYAIRKTSAPLLGNPCQAADPYPERLKRDVLPFEALAEWHAATCALANKSHAAYFKLLLFSGLRRTDAASIKLEDIHDDFVFRPLPKGGSRKAFQCPITPQLRAIIDEASAARELLQPHSPYLFPAISRTGHLSAGLFHSQLRVRGVAVSPHVLRRTYISAGASVGVSFVVLKALANHVGNGSDVTLTYIKVPFEDRMAGARKIAEFLEAKIIGLKLEAPKLLEFQGERAEGLAAE